MRQIEYRTAIREAMEEEMRRDSTVFLLGYDVGTYGGEFRISGNMIEEFGELRVADSPICEQGEVGLGVGAAVTGCKPIIEIPFMDFIPMCMDQVVNQAAKFSYMFENKKGVPLVVRTGMGGYTRVAEHHSQCFENWLVHVPGLKVAVPSTGYDVKGLLKTAIRNEVDPVIFIEHRTLYPIKFDVPEEEYYIPFGQADIKKEGKNVTVITYAYILHKCMKVAQKLEKEGISVEIVDPRTLVPLDKEKILESVKKTGKVVIVHEAVKQGGWSGEMAGIIAEEAFSYLDAPIKRVGAKSAPIPSAGILEDYVLPSEDDIEAAIRSIL